MCTAVTLIAASDDLDQINAILTTLDTRGPSRRAERTRTPGIRELLSEDEREYRLVRSPCDCGTFLGHAVDDAEESERAAAPAGRYRRKGWTEARIRRALEERERAAARPARRQPNENAAYWINLMTALAKGLELGRLGLVRHSQGASRALESHAVIRRAAGSVGDASEALAVMPDHVIHDFEMHEPSR